MAFSTEQTQKFETALEVVLDDLQDLILKVVVAGQPLDPSSRTREHLLHGAARRLKTIRRSIERIFQLFPLDQNRPLEQDALSDVQTNLHAFVMNLHGLYDNWAWAFVLRHDLLDRIGDRRRVSLFHKATQVRLPAQLRSYLTAEHITRWHSNYAKSFRDALAHRIPPYVPPAEFTAEEENRYNDLESEKVQCIKEMRWERLDQILIDQSALGRPSFVFLHAFTEDEAPRPILLHPQLLTDGMACVEFGRLFLEHWHEAAK